jgi:predicted nucleotidyltransferase
MGLPEAWHRAIEQWAEQNSNITEVWLFGSRARGEATDDKDVDLAITLMPAKESHDWAAGNYLKFGDQWQRELAALVGRSVDLELKMDFAAKGTPEIITRGFLKGALRMVQGSRRKSRARLVGTSASGT